MPNNASAKKRVRQNVKSRARNRSLRSELRGNLRTFRELKTNEERQASLPAAFSALDRAASKGIIHRNLAARKKSRLALMVNKDS